MEVKKQILKLCIEKGFLIDKEILELLSSFDVAFSLKIILSLSDAKITSKLINRVILLENSVFLKKMFILDVEKKEFNKLFFTLGVSLDDYSKQTSDGEIKILSDFSFIPKKIDVGDFVNHFRNRYEQLKSILQERQIGDLKSLRRIGGEGETQSIIVMIYDKRITKNKNIIFEVEDITGRAKVLVNSNKTELFERCKNVLPDEVVCFKVSGSKEILFVEDVIFVDSVLKTKKNSENDVCVAFSSDLHVGSKMFLEKNFLNFIKWINGEVGNNEERIVAKKIKYLFLVGDNIDGVGVFPEQEGLLAIPGILQQYQKLEEYLRMIRGDVKIIICPGQHDAVWVGEPQRPLDKEWAPGLLKMENVFLVSNPCLVGIEGKFNVLMYHGASLHEVVGQIPEIRINYGHNNPTVIVKELLKNRHLAPTHGESDYVPTEKKDCLVIDPVPDVIVTADLHRPEVSEYNNIILISSSCWQNTTPFEEKVGNNPDPCKVPILNLKTREIKIMDFSKDVEVGNGG